MLNVKSNTFSFALEGIELELNLAGTPLLAGSFAAVLSSNIVILSEIDTSFYGRPRHTNTDQ